MRKVNSWGNTHVTVVEDKSNITKNTLSIGNNNSYGDASIPAGKVSYKPQPVKEKNYLDSSLSIDEIMFKEKITFFGTPGKSNVTIGGAVASDVHGKDGSWGGSFINNLESLVLTLPSGETIECSRQINPEVFYTSIGGYGLSGSISGIKLKNNITTFSNYYFSEIKKGSGLEDLLKIFSNKHGEYSVAWIDLLNKKKNWVFDVSIPKIQNNYKIKSKNKNNLNPNFSIPFIGENKFNSMGFINQLYYKLTSEKNMMKSRQSVLYPLSFLSDTRNISRKRKIVQVQFSLPQKYEEELEELIDILIYKQSPILCSIKKISDNETNLNLSFVQKGWSVAVDFPFYNFNSDAIRMFYKKLTELEGKIYLAKDSTLNSLEFKEMYPNFNNWKKIVKSIDPNNLFQSKMSQRLELKTW